MTPGLLIAGTLCALVVLLTVAGCVVLILRQLKDRPRPLAEVVTSLGTRIGVVEADVTNLLKLIRRENARGAKARQRGREVEEVEEDPEEDMTPPDTGRRGPKTQEELDFEALCGPAPHVGRRVAS